MTTRALLSCGMAAGPVYVLVGLAQVLTREGFDVRRHALSLLSNGHWGWIQIANVFACGALVVAGARGVRRAVHPGRAGTWGPILLALYGLGFYALIAACGVFARRFAALGQRAWATYSALSGLVFFGSFAAIASGPAGPAIILGFYAAVVWIWIWHHALHRQLREALR